MVRIFRLFMVRREVISECSFPISFVILMLHFPVNAYRSVTCSRSLHLLVKEVPWMKRFKSSVVLSIKGEAYLLPHGYMNYTIRALILPCDLCPLSIAFSE